MLSRLRWIAAVMLAAAGTLLLSGSLASAQHGCCRPGGATGQNPAMAYLQQQYALQQLALQQSLLQNSQQPQTTSTLQSQSTWKSDIQRHQEANLAIDKQQRALFRQLNPQASDNQKLQRK